MSTSTDEHALLRHHGDVDARPGLVDFAVNVRIAEPPRWLRDRLADALCRLGVYPSAADDAAARAAVGRLHGCDADRVLVLNGASECFAMLPALRPRLAAVVHPSYTEPELALRDGGVPVTRVLLDAADGYALRSELVPEDADLVVLGNPTNPTSVLHPAEVITRLTRPGRVLVVDEAFADTVAGQRESLAGRTDVPGLLVVRSLTKTWGIPGLRTGYALGDPALLAELTVGRPPWPVGTLGLETVLACAEPAAQDEAEAAALLGATHRAWLAERLGALPGVLVNQPARSSFLLIRVPNGERVRAALRESGIAVRRCDTFPGLSADHLRIAVRPPETSRRLLDALRTALGERSPDRCDAPDAHNLSTIENSGAVAENSGEVENSGVAENSGGLGDIGGVDGRGIDDHSGVAP